MSNVRPRAIFCALLYSDDMAITLIAPNESPTVDVVAANIRAEAARLGLRQGDVAAALGLNQATVSLRWTGKRDWPLSDLDAVAKLLGLTVADLVTPSKNAPVSKTRATKLPRLDSNQQPFD